MSDVRCCKDGLALLQVVRVMLQGHSSMLKEGHTSLQDWSGICMPDMACDIARPVPISYKSDA